MSKKTKKGIVNVPTGTHHNVVGMIPKTLGELRTQYDGFRRVAEKVEDAKIKDQLITGLEGLYLSAANWFTGAHGNATEATA